MQSAVSFDLYVFFLASEKDLWVFLTRKNHGQSLSDLKKLSPVFPTKKKPLKYPEERMFFELNDKKQWLYQHYELFGN